jgi:hypothetical protein
MEDFKDPYYFRSEISNSDLSWLQKYWQPEDVICDLEKAYRFGTLIDCMITEQHKINYFKLTCGGYQYLKDEFERAEEMKKSFYRDQLCASMMKLVETQKIMSIPSQLIQFEGLSFTLPVRCKWDLWFSRTLWGADIKSTACTTQKQFEEACRYFDYDRQRAWYMDIAGSDQDMLIGISKINFKIFKVPIKRGDDFFESGRQKYQELAFKWWYLFQDLDAIEKPNDAVLAEA